MYREILTGVLDLYIAARLSFWEIIQFSTKIYFHTIVSMPSFWETITILNQNIYLQKLLLLTSPEKDPRVQ